MVYDLEEQEKLDAIKAWWTRYGILITTVAVAVALAVGGWLSWKAYEGYRANQAMGYFEALEEAARTDGPESSLRIKIAVATLRDDYGSTAYAARGVLIAVQALLAQQDVDGAREQLQWLAGQSKHALLQPVARVRLAGLLLDQKQCEAAMAQLSHPPAAFANLFADRKGDILAAQGKKDEARQAWQTAVDAMKANDPLLPIVQLKLDALIGA